MEHLENKSNFSFNSSLSDCTPYRNSLDDLIYIFGCAPLCVLVFLLSLMSLYVLFDSQFKENVFVYFQIESFLIMVDSLIGALLPVYKCKTCQISRTLFAKIIYKYFFIYTSLILETSSIIVNILQVYCCIRMLKNLKPNLIYNHPYVASIVSIAALFILSLNQLFKLAIVKITDTCGQTVYRTVSTDFSATLFNKVYYVTFATFSNFILLILMVFLDLVLMCLMKENLDNKINMAKQNSTNGSNKAKKSQIKLAKMIMVNCTVSVVYHFDLLFSFILGDIVVIDFNYLPFYSITTLLLYVCEGSKFIFFYRFNKRFRASLNSKLLGLILGQHEQRQRTNATNLYSLETKTKQK